MLRTTKAAAVLGAAALSSSLLSGVPASAAAAEEGTAKIGHRVADRRGDAGRPYDIRDMYIYPRYRPNYFFVQIRGYDLRPGRYFNGATVSLDTDRDALPDWRINAAIAGDGDGYKSTTLARIPGWRADGQRRPCARLEVRFRPRQEVVEFSIHRSCIKRPQRRIRVNGQTWNYTRYRQGRPVYGRFDAVPGVRTLSRGF